VAIAVVVGVAPARSAVSAPAFAHKCFTAYQGQTYELDYTIAQDEPESAVPERAVRGTVSVLDATDSLIFTFKGVTRRGARSVVADTPNGPLFKSVAVAQVATNSFGAAGSATFRRLQRPFIPDIARLTLSGQPFDFACDLAQYAG
jgi:hypothetical protein